jgi:hypothetical protein
MQVPVVAIAEAIDIADIAALATDIAHAGAVSVLDPVVGGIFDYTVAITAMTQNLSGLMG